MFDLDALPKDLLTVSNPKTVKGEKGGYLTAILHLAPAKLSGRNVCPHASANCIRACLNTAGRGGIDLDANGLNMIQAARIRRTRLFHAYRSGFMAQLAEEIARHEKRALKHGLKPAVRLNGTSDLPWERFAHASYPNIMAAFPEVTFYDYTKYPLKLRPLVGAIPNYSLTFSLSERNDEYAKDALARDVNVAVVFNTGRSSALPDNFMGVPVVDGDISDLRFLDPPGVVVGLRAKGRAKQDRSGFVRAA